MLPVLTFLCKDHCRGQHNQDTLGHQYNLLRGEVAGIMDELWWILVVSKCRIKPVQFFV